jgi:hydroxylamine reductase (hybrid-cluster protein)
MPPDAPPLVFVARPLRLLASKTSLCTVTRVSSFRFGDLFTPSVLGWYMNELTKTGVKDNEIAEFIYYSTFSTLTNVNFDDSRFVDMLKTQQRHINKARSLYDKLPGAKAGPTLSLVSESDSKALLFLFF